MPVAASEETPFDGASLTKPLVTGLLLGILDEEGVLEGSAGVDRWVEELRGSPLAPVSLLELARHEAGLPAWLPLYLRSEDREGYLQQIAGATRVEQRGRCEYSDLGYIALGVALERAGGATLDQLFATRIARPLGLERSGFAVAPRRFPQAAATERGNAYERGLTGPPGGTYPWREQILQGEVHDGNASGLGGVAGHAGLFTTAEEAAAIAREILAPGQLPLGERGRSRLLVAPRAGARTAGLAPAEQSQASRGVLPRGSPGHTGFTGTSLWLDVARDGIYVLLTNRVHPTVSSRNFQWLRRAFHRLASADSR